MQEEIKDWTNGAIVHVHARIEDEIPVQRDQLKETGLESYMQNYKDGSFTLSAMTYFFENIFDEKIPITDTQHPAYVLDPNYDDLPVEDKLKYFHPKVINSTLDLMARCILERRNIIRRSDALDHVLSGVEVDIISSNGRLSIHDEALAELDYVTCSFHPDFWFVVGNGEISRKTQMIDTYVAAVENKNIDTLSHPTINIPPEVRNQMAVSDWEELFQFMREKEVAFEINLDSTNLVYNDGKNLDRSLILGAMKYGVPIVIGFDFHYPHDWGAYLSPRFVDSKNIESLFNEYLRDGTLDKLLARVIGNIYVLKQMGLKPSNIVNHSSESFNKWLAPRKASS